MPVQTSDIKIDGHVFQYYSLAGSIEEAKKVRQRWLDRGHNTRVKGGTGVLKGKILIFVENLR